MEFKVNLRSAIYSLSDALDLVGVDELFHGKRAAYTVLELGRQAGVEGAELDNLFFAALLHDCGVSSTRVHQALTSQFSWARAKEHCDKGYTLLRHCPPLAHLADVIRFHHTHWDELELYDVLDPQLKLHANLIFLADRIDALNDQGSGVDILVSNDEIRDMVAAQSGKMFAPQWVDAFLRLSESESYWGGLESDHLDRYLSCWVRQARPWEADYASFKAVAELFANVVDTKTEFTAGHSLGVGRLARRVGELCGLESYSCEMLEIAGLLHDIGRLRVPDEIMEKPNPLDPEEFDLMERFSFDGYKILGKVEGLEDIALWAGYHHERPGEEGYPLRRDDELPLEAHILNAVDVFQAMAQERPYRGKKAPEEIIAAMRAMVEDGRLDAGVVEKMAANLDLCWQAAVVDEATEMPLAEAAG